MDLLEEAAQEAAHAGRTTPPDSDLARRQAAEKIWGYVASELNRAFREAGYRVNPGPDAHGDRRKWLREIDEVLGTRFEEREEEYARLHGDCFYESKCPGPEALEAKVKEARALVEEVRRAIGEVKRRGPR